MAEQPTYFTIEAALAYGKPGETTEITIDDNYIALFPDFQSAIDVIVYFVQNYSASKYHLGREIDPQEARQMVTAKKAIFVTDQLLRDCHIRD